MEKGIYSFIKGKDKNDLKIIYDQDLQLGEGDLLNIAQEGELIRVKKGSSFKHPLPKAADNSYEGMVLFYLGANELRKGDVSKETLNHYLNLNKSYFNFFSKNNDAKYFYPLPKGDSFEELELKVVQDLKDMDNLNDSNKLKEIFGRFKSYTSYIIQAQAMNSSPKKQEIQETGFFGNCPISSLIKDRMGTAQGLYFSPIEKVFDNLPIDEAYEGLARNLYNIKRR